MTKTRLAVYSLIAASTLSLMPALAYDGDVDFSAPYMTLDPETGKLITVDPKQQPGYQEQQAARQQQHEQGATTTPAQQQQTPPETTAAVTDHAPESQEAASPIPIITVIAGVIAVSVIVVMSLKKSKSGQS